MDKELANELRKIAINLLNGARLEVQAVDVVPRNTDGAIARAALRRIIGRESEENAHFNASLYNLVDEAVGVCATILNSRSSVF